MSRMSKRLIKGLLGIELVIATNFSYHLGIFPLIKSDHDKASYHIIAKEPTKKMPQINPKKRYAILIQGEELPKKGALRLISAYNTLKKAGYTDETILVFAPKENGLEEIFDYKTEKSKIESSLGYLAKTIEEDDEFFFFYSGHSNGKKLNVTSGSSITIWILEEMITPIRAKKKIMVFDSCYSGVFSERFGQDNTIVISTSKENKVSYTSSKFSELLFSALTEKRGDSNKDGKTSLKEAFIYAAENDPLQSKKTKLGTEYLKWRQVPNLQYQNINPDDVFFE